MSPAVAWLIISMARLSAVVIVYCCVVVRLSVAAVVIVVLLHIKYYWICVLASSQVALIHLWVISNQICDRGVKAFLHSAVSLSSTVYTEIFVVLKFL